MRNIGMVQRLVLCSIVVGSCAAVGTATVQAPQRRVVRVTAERFAFTPSEIVIDANEEVELRIKSDDTSHGFRLIGTDVNVVIPKRGKEEASVLLQPMQAGRYTFECNRMCGAGHNFMRGVLVVRERSSETSDR